MADIEEHVRRYQQVRPLFARYCQELKTILKEGVKPLSPLGEVQGRAKTVASFAEKILRKGKYEDPLTEMTDLCGVRVVVQTTAEVDTVCRFIRDNFEIDLKNSLDQRERLRAKEFGYRSVHYVVQFKPGRFEDVPKKLYGLKAEIQVRTIVQHAWSDIGHDRLYKSGFTVPDIWEREAARLAAALEGADDGFSRLVEGLDAYRSHFGAYLTPEQIKKEIAICEIVLRHDPENARLTHRLARLAMNRDDWSLAIRAVNAFRRNYPQEMSSELLVCLGLSLCELHRESPNSVKYREGRRRLGDAVTADSANVEARVALAETAREDGERLDLYAAAFAVGPTDPAAVEGYTRQKVQEERTTAFLPLLRPSLEAAIEKCRLQAEVGVNIPRALYRMAGFQLLLGPAPDWERRCLSTFAAAVKRTEALSTLEHALDGVSGLARVEPGRRDVRAAHRFLLVARQARLASRKMDRHLASLVSGAGTIQGPVIIIAGGCDPAHASMMASYRELLEETLADFSGTLISGGTEQGISGLVGGIGKASKGRIRTLGYIPASLPTDQTATIDRRYTELRRTDGEGAFSALEPLQNWIDLLASGVRPENVRVIGINGGDIAGLEYRFAWALGAEVAVVRDSGREADRIEAAVLADELPGMLVLPRDVQTLRAFVYRGRTQIPLTEAQHAELARLAHVHFLAENRHKHPDPAMQPWDKLATNLKASNRDQIAYMTQILRAAGFDVVKAKGVRGVMKFNKAEIEKMARMEHGRWNVERIRDGWRHDAERDPKRKRSPYLVSWDELPDGVRKWDRLAVKRFPGLLAKAGLKIVARKKPR